MPRLSPKARLSKLRKAYLAHPSDARLRAYLTVKARLYRFDKRFFAYYKVNPKVNRGCRRAACRAYVAGLVPTATTGGTHAPGSWHYRKNGHGEGQAVDFGLRGLEVGTARGQRKLATFQRKELWRREHGRLPRMVELIGPTNNQIVLAGLRTSLPEGSALENQHDNHVHEAFLG